MQVQFRHSGHAWSGGVEDGDENQSPTSRRTGILNFGDGEETDDDVWQTCRTDHQRESVNKHIQRAETGRRGVLREAKFRDDLVYFAQQGHVRADKITTQTELRQRVSGQSHGDKDRRNRVCNNQYTVLGDLGVSDAFHTTENGVHEHDTHTDENPGCVGNAQETGEGDTDTGHLADDICCRGDDQADNSNRTRSLGVVAVTDKLGHGKFAELPQVRCQQHGQEHIAAGPAHQEQRTAVAHAGNETRHGDK